MTKANINIAMLTWARGRSGVVMSEFARKCGVSEERLSEWESGKRQMTFNQAMRFAEKAHVPFGYLFLEEPPVDELPIPDLRTVDGQEIDSPSSELLDLIKLMLLRQEWYKEYLQQNFVDPNPFVGCLSIKDGIDSVISSMRDSLGVGEYPERGNWEEYYRELVRRIDGIGILVMRQGNLGHHSRPLKVEEFRGFAIADEYAPIVFVNHADAPGARLFTLIHELCHIWIGQSGVSNGSTHAQRQEEVFCNAVAAEFLVPEKEFSLLWNQGLDDWRDNLAPLEAHFHVSTWVLARRALTLGYIEHKDYLSYVASQRAAFQNRERKGKGPTYYKTKKAQISQEFSKAVVSQALGGQILLRDAGHLLGGIKPNKITDFAKELGI